MYYSDIGTQNLMMMLGIKQEYAKQPSEKKTSEVTGQVYKNIIELTWQKRVTTIKQSHTFSNLLQKSTSSFKNLLHLTLYTSL